MHGSLGTKTSSGGEMRHVLSLRHAEVDEQKKRGKLCTLSFILIYTTPPDEP